ncbi:MAG: polyphosphate polymerase domain-containing protein [Verrucomicrobia bacterium]|nr:polyphosphate polymerase domain-containing protein [Verrucomicrobiota bacterium]MCH8513389.1 polyphosphate polymerase domain-containing protein [Kiritimatiellia bacterium]
MRNQGLQSERFELKYHVTEQASARIRNCLKSRLAPDRNAGSSKSMGYPVYSIYFDSRDFELRQRTLNGDRNRYKLRMRYYDLEADSPVFLEIKRRQGHAILKERCAITREAADHFLAGGTLTPDDLLDPSPKEISALRNFARQAQLLNARPITKVCYDREAWENPEDHDVRVTFDREVLTAPCTDKRVSSPPDHPLNVFGRDVILELKFTGRYPLWMAELVRHCNLLAGSAAKYVDGLILLEECGRIRPGRSGHPPLPTDSRRNAPAFAGGSR